MMIKISDPKHRLSRCQERVSQLETVLDVNSLLNTELDLDSLLDKIMKTARSVMNADIASLALSDEEKGDLEFKLAVGVNRDLIPGLGKLSRVPLGEGINGTVAQTGKALMLEDCLHHPTFNPGYEKKIGMGFGPILAAPIKVKGKILGSCSVIRDRKRQHCFSKSDLSLFNMFCDSAGLAVHNARTHLTILRNQILENNIAFSQSDNSCYCHCHD
ncbi:MAG: GAF domain-containing protein [Nitrospinales bacterium]